MAQVNADRVRQQATFAGGTGAVTLTTTPVSGFQSFLSGWGASGSGWVCAVIGSQWQVAEASINAGGTTLTFGTIISSSTGSQISFAAGTMDCFAVIPGSKLGLNAKGTVGAPSISFFDDRDSGWYWIGANNIGMAIAGAKVGDWSTAGLAVTGTVISSGNISVGAAGTHIQINFAGGSEAIAEYVSGNANPFWVIGRDAVAGGVPSIVFNPTGSSTAAAAGVAVGQFGTRTLAFFTSNATTLTNRMQIDGSGVVTITALATGSLTSVSGVITSSSDATLKDVRGPFVRSIQDLMRMENPILYNWNKESGLDQKPLFAGWAAQGVRKGIPEAVSIGLDGKLSLNDRPILAATVNAVVDLHERVSKLEKGQG